MTGALDRARAAVKACHDDAGDYMGALIKVSDRIDEALAELSSTGPLGSSDNPNLASAVRRLVRCKGLVSSAIHHLGLSRSALTDFSARALSE